MTEEELAAIEARAKAATPGPWVVADEWRNHLVDGRFQDGYWPVVSQPGMDHEGAWLKGNAAFVAASREDVPALVAEVRRLRESLAAAAIHARHKALEEAVDLVKGLAEDARDDGDGSDDAASLALEDAGEALLSLRADR